jgi:RNA polymerase sigma factor (sigma-70 family)
MDDNALLREYVEHRSEKAFAELVSRHIDLVYSTALRIVQGADLAEDVSQSVFVELARKAGSIRSGNALPGWLYRVTRCRAANAVRSDRIRREHEMEAMNMIPTNPESPATWEAILPHLDEAMHDLDHEDQNAIVQRYFQGRSWREVGATLKLSEDAAQKRVSRALIKLHDHMVRQGVTVSVSAIGLAISAHAVHAAPASLVPTITAASMGGVGSSTASLTLKALLMKKTTVGALALFAAVAAVTTPLLVSKAKPAQLVKLDGPVTEKDLQRGLLLHMTFDKDESDRGKITDVSGQGNDGKLSGAHWTADGKKGGAYEFTADGNEIVIANNKSLNPGQLTLSAWIKTSYADAKWRRIFDKSYSRGYALSVAGDWEKNDWRGLVSTELGPGTHFLITKTKVNDGQWHHVVTTFDGTTEAIYLDGQIQGQSVSPGTVGATDFNLVIGCNRSNIGADDLGMSFRGLIDEPRMWNRALSAKEVEYLYNLENGSATTASAN